MTVMVAVPVRMAMSCELEAVATAAVASTKTLAATAALNQVLIGFPPSSPLAEYPEEPGPNRPPSTEYAGAMEVAIAGGHGKIGQLLGAMLVGRGDGARGLIRDPAQAGDLRQAGIEPAVCDLEGDDDVAAAVRGADAVVFAAGAGPGSGAERKRTMDLDGAVKLISAAKEAGIRRYLMISSMGAGSPPAEGGDVFGEYLRAKAEADRALQASGLAYTIIRPGSLTDEPGTGLVTVGDRLDRSDVPRADVAATLAASLQADSTVGRTFELRAGETPIEEALADL